MFQYCDALTRPLNDEHLNKAIRSESTHTRKYHKPDLDGGIIILNMTKIPVKEKQPVEHNKNLNVALPTHTNPKASPLSAKKSVDTIKKATTLKLTKSGTVDFMNNLEESIKKHPILSKNSKVITDLLSEAIENATIALRDAAEKQQKETAMIPEKLPAAEVKSKPSTVSEKTAVHSVAIKSNQLKPCIPIIHNLYECNVILCNDSSKDVKINSSVILKNEDGITRVPLRDKTITVKHEDPCPSSDINHFTESKAGKKQMLSKHGLKKPMWFNDPTKSKLCIMKKQNLDDIKKRERIISILKPKITVTPPTNTAVPEMIENEYQIEEFCEEAGKYY